MPPQKTPSRSPSLGRLTYAFFKPYDVVSQFTPIAGHRSLAEFGPFPPDVYPVGRLDWDTEGLLILSNDNGLKHRLADPKFDHPKTYLVQVEHVPQQAAIQQLREGVIVGGKKTRPAIVRLLPEEPALPERPVPIRYRKNIPTAWLEISITEGRNHQVRKMTAAAGHPTLRLVRLMVGGVSLGTLKPGEFRAVDFEEFFPRPAGSKSMPRNS